MKWEMEILSNESYPNWFLEENKSTRWTQEENKLFENSLAVYDRETPDRWQKVADMIPGKTVADVIKQYKELEDDVSHIEAGLVPIPGYTTSSFTLEWVNNHGFGTSGKRSSTRPSDQERKKGVPWTEDEHRLFLLGLKKYGKGDWRNISRHFVISRTPTQVASHAQKYFIRQLSGGKDKRRSSIHDITTLNFIDTTAPSDNNRLHSPDQSVMHHSQPNMNSMPKSLFDWNQPHNGASRVFNPTPPYGIASYAVKSQGQSPHRGAFHGSHVGSHGAMLQSRSTSHYHG